MDDAKTTTPPDGWVAEFEEARADAKKINDDDAAAAAAAARCQLRIGKAAFRLRLWKKSLKASEKGLQLLLTAAAAAADNTTTTDSAYAAGEEEQQQLKEYRNLARKELEKELNAALLSRVGTPEYRDECKDLMTGETDGDVVNWAGGDHVWQYPPHNNVNLLQAAALRGDVLWLEDLVRFGVALDYSIFVDGDTTNPRVLKAPPNSTALLLVCLDLATYCGPNSRIAPSLMPPYLISILEGQVECAIRLVQLGADFNRKLQGFPQPSSSNNNRTPHHPLQASVEQMYIEGGLVGKTARELAIMSGKTRLVDVMNEFSTEQAKLEKVQCRCGSRLPWRQCHAGRRVVESPHYVSVGGGGGGGGRGPGGPTNNNSKQQLCWRYSPLAPCPCKITKKKHYDCCWDAPAPCYLDDRDGGINRLECASLSDPIEQYRNASMRAMIKMRLEEMEGPLGKDDLLFPARDEHGNSLGRELSHDEYINMMANGIRDFGPEHFRFMFGSRKHPKARIGEDWDNMVYAGCVERLQGFSFLWTDIHWQIEKTDLLERVVNWNSALERYCNDKGLTGAEREAVIQMHTASPYAPCANPLCNNIETQVKEYKRCARCKKVAYCSRECQAADWKSGKHKVSCVGASMMNMKL